MRESCTSGSVRGAPSDRRLYSTLRFGQTLPPRARSPVSTNVRSGTGLRAEADRAAPTHLVVLARHSDAVREALLILAQRECSPAAKKPVDARETRPGMFESIAELTNRH